MSAAQNRSLNVLLNQAAESSQRSPAPIQFFRAQQVDSFYPGKVRVSRDRQGNIIPGGVIKKKRLADLNVFSPRQAFDWRISCNVEDPGKLLLRKGSLSNVRSRRSRRRARFRERQGQGVLSPSILSGRSHRRHYPGKSNRPTLGRWTPPTNQAFPVLLRLSSPTMTERPDSHVQTET